MTGRQGPEAGIEAAREGRIAEKIKEVVDIMCLDELLASTDEEAIATFVEVTANYLETDVQPQMAEDEYGIFAGRLRGMLVEQRDQATEPVHRDFFNEIITYLET